MLSASAAWIHMGVLSLTRESVVMPADLSACGLIRSASPASALTCSALRASKRARSAATSSSIVGSRWSSWVVARLPIVCWRRSASSSSGGRRATRRRRPALRWLLRPISFLESCRRRFGDAFSVSFLGFQTPMVMLSDPEAIRALYTVPGHTLPPGRTVALQPIMGSRSLLLLEGREHLARRKLMLPPFHGARMRAYEATVREVVAREVDSWPAGEPFALHPRMQAVTLEVTCGGGS